MKKITLALILTDVRKDKLLHNAGVLESFKRLIEPVEYLHGNLREDQTVNKVICNLKKVIMSDGKYEIQAIFTPHQNEGAWCNRETILVSTGSVWGKFANYLESLGYKGQLPKRYTNEVLV